MAFPYAEIENKIGYVFEDKALLKEAFTHSTYANAHGGKDNERLEYLGDAVLQLVVTEWQYKDDERASEGELTRERQLLVCEDALYEAVQELNVKGYLLVEGSRANVGKKTISSLFETLIAAIYLDGGYAPAKSFILRYGRLRALTKPQNPKGELQEYLQKRGEEPPTYESKKTGKDNEPTFYCVAFARGRSATGEARSKRAAEQIAAEKLLQILKNED